LVERSLEQKVCDRLLLLRLIKEISPLDAYKLQKLPFRLEYELHKEGRRIFNYEFFQYDQGPLSVEVYADRDFLEEQSLISVDGYTVQITQKGEEFLSEFKSVLDKNRPIVQKLVEVAKRFSKKDSFELIKDTHELIVEHRGKPTRLKDLPKLATILGRPDRSSLEVDTSTLETLIVCFHHEFIDNLRKARREGSTSSPYKPLLTA